MKDTKARHRHQRSAVFAGFLMFGLIIFMIQLWLFVMTLEMMLAGKTEMVLSAAIVSILLCAVNVWMLIGIERLMKYR